MRIIAGTMRGRSLVAPKGLDTRPTTDRVRESLFSALSSQLGGFGGLRVLDAFAGSGALGLEALSRGAAHVTFVEKDSRALDALERNIATLGVSASCRVVRGDVFALAGKAVPGGPFSLIMVDAPYTLDAARIAAMLESLKGTGQVVQKAVCSWEHAASTQPVWPAGFEVVRSKRYGTTKLELAVFETEE